MQNKESKILEEVNVLRKSYWRIKTVKYEYLVDIQNWNNYVKIKIIQIQFQRTYIKEYRDIHKPFSDQRSR